MISGATTAHVSFFIELLNKNEISSDEKKAIVDKICHLTTEPRLIRQALGEIWHQYAAQNRWHDCFQVALQIDESKLLAETSFRIALASESYSQRKKYLKRALEYWSKLKS